MSKVVASSKDDALIKKDPIDISQNYTNVNPNTQEIWALVENNDLTSINNFFGVKFSLCSN